MSGLPSLAPTLTCWESGRTELSAPWSCHIHRVSGEHTHVVDVGPRSGAGLGRPCLGSTVGWNSEAVPYLAACAQPHLTSMPSPTRRGEK